jgi:hypothetical protein
VGESVYVVKVFKDGASYPTCEKTADPTLRVGSPEYLEKVEDGYIIRLRARSEFGAIEMAIIYVKWVLGQRV